MTETNTTAPAATTPAAAVPAPAQAIAGLQNAQKQQDPFAARVAMLSTAIAKYDAEFETESVKSGKRPSFLTIAGHLFQGKSLSDILRLLQTSGGIPPEALKDPKSYQMRRDTVKEMVEKFNSLRAEGEPEATVETFAAFLEAKREQAKLLGHEIRNPAFSLDRYHEMYPIALEHVSEAKRKALSKRFGEVTPESPKDGDPSASFPLYRMYDAPDLVAVASGRDIAPMCQQAGRCFTSVGVDFLEHKSIAEAYEFLTARGSLLKPSAREQQASILSSWLFSNPKASMLELYGSKDEQPEGREGEQDAQPKEENAPKPDKSAFKQVNPADSLSAPLPASLQKAARAELAF